MIGSLDEIARFIAACDEAGIPYDFVSTHSEIPRSNLGEQMAVEKGTQSTASAVEKLRLLVQARRRPAALPPPPRRSRRAAHKKQETRNNHDY